MKNSLEQMLTKAKAGAGIKEPTIGELLKSYWFDSGNWDKSVNAIHAQKDTGNPVNLQYNMSSWDRMLIWFGVFHKMTADGHKPLQMVGLTDGEVGQFQEICIKIRTKIVEGQPTEKTTTTKAFYDQIVAEHF